MKKALLTLALVACTFGSVAVAQNNNNDARRAEAVARQIERLERDLKITDAQKAKFEDIYKRYQEELQGLRQNQMNRNQNREADSKKELTEEEATAQLAEYFAQQESQLTSMQARIDVQKKYCAEFSQVLTPQQLLRVFQPQRTQQQGGNRGGGRGGFGGGGGGFGGGGFGGGGF